MSIDAAARGTRFLEGLGRVTIGGFGRSGRAAAALLSRHGVGYSVIDARPRADLAPALDALPGPPPFTLESAAAALLVGTDTLILSPGIDPRRTPWAEARAAGVTVLAELELGWRLATAPVIAISGTNGKSTATALTAALLQGAGRDARAGGNLGTPLCDLIESPRPDTVFVVEVSSFQLEATHAFAPEVAVLLNITPDHQDRYATFPEYVAAKERLFESQTPGQWAIVVVDDPQGAEVAARLARRAARGRGPRLIAVGASADDFWASLPPGEGGRSGSGLDARSSGAPDLATFQEGELLVRVDGVAYRFGSAAALPIPGPHNRLNVLAALAAAFTAGAAAERLAAPLAAFPGLPHRLETVGMARGMRWVNDSKATNVDSVLVALRSYEPGRLVVLLGGKDKGADLAPLATELRARARCVVTFGLAGPRFAAALREPLAGAVDLRTASDLAGAVRLAAAAARPGDVVLLSPACASFDAYANFEERGAHFRALVEGLSRETAHGA